MHLYSRSCVVPNFFKLYFWNRQNYWKIGGEELRNVSVEKEIKWEECTK